MQQQKKEQKQSTTSANEAINSTYSETPTTKRRQYDDTPVWIIEQGNIYRAVIAEYMIMESDNEEDILDRLDRMEVKLLCTMIAVISNKVYTENEREKTSK